MGNNCHEILAAQRRQRLGAGALPAVELAEHHAHHRAGLADHAGLGDGGADVGDAAHHGLLAQNRRQALGGIDAVLQRDDGGILSDHRLDRRPRRWLRP